MSYLVVYTRGHTLPRHAGRDYAVCTPVRFPTVADARWGRKVSGDLVVDERTFRIAQSDVWLFDWEKENATCYPRQMQRLDREAP